MLADKIIQLRKKQGWSQEELAERMNVSRQAVSKWESAQAVPELDKVLQMAELFEVSTDYLLKDNIEEEPDGIKTHPAPERRVDTQQATDYLSKRKHSAPLMALATMLCILSPICLILLGAFADAGSISATVASVVGLVVLFVLIAAAVALFVYCGMLSAPYLFLDQEAFTLETVVKNSILAQREAFRRRYIICNICAVCLCILSPVPLLIAAFFASELVIAATVCSLLAQIAIAVFLFVFVGTHWGAYQRLLREGEFTDRAKRYDRLMDRVGSVYWLAAAAIYLAWSFASGKWGRTWIIWPVAGVLFVIISTVCEIITGKENKKG